MVRNPTRSRINAGKRTPRTATAVLMSKYNKGMFGPRARPGARGDTVGCVPAEVCRLLPPSWASRWGRAASGRDRHFQHVRHWGQTEKTHVFSWTQTQWCTETGWRERGNVLQSGAQGASTHPWDPFITSALGLMSLTSRKTTHDLLRNHFMHKIVVLHLIFTVVLKQICLFPSGQFSKNPNYSCKSVWNFTHQWAKK